MLKQHCMIMRTHADNSKIPKGKATLYLTNGGCVGTNNGFPFGQSALFSESLAHAIATVWMYVQTYHPKLEEMPHPEYLPKKVMNWING